jgi:phage gpG-like protein
VARSLVRTSGVVSLELSPPLEFIEAQFGEFGRELLDFTGLWERFADTLEDVERDRFVTEGHGDWPPLAPSTLRDKTAHGFPVDILVRTGKLKESLTNREIAMRMTPQSMSWGTDVPYARYHQEGGQRVVTRRRTVTEQHEGKGYQYSREVSMREDGHPPQRKLIDIRVEDRRRLEASMVGWINEVAARTLGRVAA